MKNLAHHAEAEKPENENENVFARLWALGYRRLVPIIPPDAEISAGSVLSKRVGTHQDGRGKTPGVKGNNGWYSFDWVPYEADEHDLTRWHAMGAGVGIKTGALGDGTSLVAIDADTTDEALATIIAVAIERRFGTLPLRFGRAPKALFPVRVRGRFQYSRIEFGPENERVEILSDGRQFVAHGIHPKTDQPYRWERELPTLADLPVFDEAELLALLEDLRVLLPAASKAVIREGGGGIIDQASLRGDPALIRRAIEALPNTTELFPAREDCLAVGYAIKGALQDDPDLALDLFQDWCESWQDPPDGKANTREWVEGEWRRMKAPFRVGAGRVYELAEKHSNGRFSRAEQWFEPVNDNDPLFPVEEREPEPSDATIAWFDPETWAGKPIPVREWEVRNWIPRHEVTLLYGDGGIGKTLLAHQYAVAAAAGVPWMGQETRQARVMCFFCEDSEDELQRRHEDILASMGLMHADTAGRLRMSSRRNVENLMAVWDRDTGRMRHLPVWHQLRADALAFRADVVILDTIADIFAGEEQNRAQVTSFVKGVLGRLAHDIGGSVIALGHPSKAGQQSGTGTSGSTGWSNAVRSRLYLKYPDKVTSGNVRELEGMKSNYGPKGAKLKIRWNRGAFDVIASSAPSRSGEASSLTVGVRSIEASADSAVVDAILAHPDARMSLGAKNSQFYAPTVLRKREPELFLAFSPAEVVEAVERLEAVGIIRTVEIGRSASRHPVLGLRVDVDKLSTQTARLGSVFE